MAHKTKGARTEFRCQQDLEKEGYNTIRVIQTKWCKKDFFELFDVIGKRLNKVKYIQVKTNKVDKNAIEKIRKFKERFGNINESYELWVWFDRKGFKKIII